MATTTPRGTGGPPWGGRGVRLNLAIDAGGGDGWSFSLPGGATGARDPGPLIPGPRPVQG